MLLPVLHLPNAERDAAQGTGGRRPRFQLDGRALKLRAPIASPPVFGLVFFFLHTLMLGALCSAAAVCVPDVDMITFFFLLFFFTLFAESRGYGEKKCLCIE